MIFKKFIRNSFVSGHQRHCMHLPMRFLEGYKVLDLSRVLAGPFCTMLLGDLGAEIIKVEEMNIGDPTRGWGPPFRREKSGKNSSFYFHSVNRNKQSLAMNFKHPEAQHILHELVKTSDILVENYLPGALKRYNMDFNSLNKINPELIYCSITGYGQTGPLSSQPGYDLIAASQFGLLSITGPLGGEPCRAGASITDLATGLLAKSAILAALVPKRSAESKIRGCHIDVNLMSTQIAINGSVAADYLNTDEVPKRIGTSHRNLVPYKAFLASDGKYLIIGTGSDPQFIKLAHHLEHPEWINDPRLKTNADRVNNREYTDELIGNVIASNTTLYWLKKLANSGLPHGPVNDMREVFNDPQVKYHLKRLVLTWQPEELDKTFPEGTKLSVPGSAINILYPHQKEFQNQYIKPPPRLAQHTRSIMSRRLNFTDEKIDELVKRKIIQTEDNII